MKTRDPVPPRPPRLTRARAAQAAANEAATAVVVAAKAPSKRAAVAGSSSSSKEVAATSSKTASKAPSTKASSTTITAAASEIVVVGPSTAATVTTTSPITSAITTSTSTSNTPAIITTTTTPNTVAAALANTTFTIIIRQPPPIPDPPKPLDLDTLVARRVEAAASAGSASAPALGEDEEDEENEGEDDDITEEEETEDTGAGETREKTTKKKKTTTTTAAELSTPEAAAVSKLLENFIFVCPNCFDSFRSEKDLATHKYVVHQVASYVCSYYAVPAPTLEGEGAGTGTSTGKTSKDGGCDFVTQDVALFKKHEAMHLKPPAHFCAICLDPFEAVEALTAHITAKHGTFACYVCGLVLPNRALHSSHMVSFHKEAALKCEVCPYKTYLKSPFERHVRNHRQYKPCTVEGCNEAFSSEERLEEHIARLHRNVRQHRCERCAEDNTSAEVPLFYSLKRLQKHLVEVHGDSMLLCDRCDFKAANRRALVLHSRSGCSETLNYRPYRCTVNEEEGGNQACQAAFRTEARLRAHMAARHTAERRFPCPEENCDRRFRSALQLGRHQRDAHPADVEVVETTEVDDLVDLAYLNELLGGRPRSLGGGNPATAATSAGALYAKPFRCRSDGCGAHFGLRTELIKHERSCFFNKRRASAAVATASTPSTSRKSNASAAASSSPAAKGSRGRPKGSSSTSTPSSSFSTTSNRPTSRAPKASTSSKAAAAAAAAEAMAVDEAATAIDSLMMMRAAESGGGHSSATAAVAEVITTSSQGNSSTELITTEVISLPMEHLGEHQYITTRYHV